MKLDWDMCIFVSWIYVGSGFVSCHTYMFVFLNITQRVEEKKKLIVATAGVANMSKRFRETAVTINIVQNIIDYCYYYNNIEVYKNNQSLSTV